MSAKVRKAGTAEAAGPAYNPYDDNGPSPMLEGPGHECTTGTCASAPFRTKDWKEWVKHIRTHEDAFEQGVAPCAICGNEVNMNKVPTRAGRKPIHRECVPDMEVF